VYSDLAGVAAGGGQIADGRLQTADRRIADCRLLIDGLSIVE